MESLHNTISEPHPLFPSGEWEGFYTYSWSPKRHMMAFHLNFKNGSVSGGGVDDVAPFHWRGVYDTEDLLCTMTKFYATHTVEYRGYVDENGIWGNWRISDYCTGGFHLWPKSKVNEKEAKEVNYLGHTQPYLVVIGN